MQGASHAVSLKPNALKSLSMKDLRDWAFPHWYLWAAVLALFILNAAWLGLNTRITMNPTWYLTNAVMVFAASCALVFRILKAASFDWFLHRMWCALMCVFLAAVLMGNLQILNHLTMTTAFPMADQFLLSWDRAIGFEWLAYAKAMTVSPLVTKTLFIAYNSLTFAGLGVVAAIWVALNNRVRVMEIIFLVVSTAIVCITIACAFPARAAMDLLADQDLLSRLNIGAGVYHIEQLMALRGNAPIFIEPANLEGLATFPSFHTCLGLLIIWGSRGHWLTGTLGALTGMTIIAATPIFGGHYLVDVICGSFVTGLAIALWHFKIRPNVANHIPASTPGAYDFPWAKSKKSV
jgi:hypothetical protein